ncbi:methyl-accepting chemotaxis protein [Thiomicrospira sp. ALE5]|uniref:methyl-accepting chemotaxis protein n=1 Tax=Thiomicrospira sp. ALE5 TaxID=748650 RepID=UPI0008EFCAF1|nr:methyl-accepting chemotaxis protein [Thiomicrospira sp. ALE5]SFR53739.1 HAMP domain-containing protein [Thiomicrospira sp. ALE5]
MFKSIRAKLLGSFIVITLMVIGLAVYSIVKVQESAGGFADYRTLAINAVVATDVDSSMFATRMNLMRYLRSSSPENAEGFNARYNELVNETERLTERLTGSERERQAQEIMVALREYRTNFDRIQLLIAERDTLVHALTFETGPQIEQNITDILRSAETPEVVRDLGLLNRNLLVARIAGQRFIREGTPDIMEIAYQEFERSEQRLATLRENMQNLDLIAQMRDTEQLIDVYVQQMRDLQRVIDLTNSNISEMDRIGSDVEGRLQEVVSRIQAEQNQVGPMVQALNEDIVRMMIIISLLVVVLSIAVAVYIPRLIARGLSAIQGSLAQISQTGNFSIRADDKRQDEIGEMGKAVNFLLSNMQDAISEANEVVKALSEGRFDQRVTRELVGDLNKLKDGINTSADNITDVMAQLKKTMGYLRDGQFSVNIDTQAQGEYKAMIDSASTSMAAMNRVISEINSVMSNVSEGQFSERVKIAAAGDMNKLKDSINATVTVLEDVIGDITRVMDAQSQGDLTQAVTTDCQGQLDQLKTAINANADNLAGIIAGALNSADVVNGAANEVSKGSQDLSQRVQEQAAALEETSATMEEMNSAVQNNTQNALEATRVAQDVQLKANDGSQVMQQTIAAMNAIQESSHKISEIVSLIDGIAFQTNLLALNAAVEAARAGDHGRGFAVVAGEVRALAQKSAEAAKDIKALIDESVVRIDEGSKLASSSGDMLAEINNAIENVTSMIEHIGEASREQADGVNQVHQAVADIDQVTQQNAALVEETSAAAESMSEQAQELSRNMAFFNTGRDLHRPVKQLEQSKPIMADKLVKPASLPGSAKPSDTKTTDADEWTEF